MFTHRVTNGKGLLDGLVNPAKDGGDGHGSGLSLSSAHLCPGEGLTGINWTGLESLLLVSLDYMKHQKYENESMCMNDINDKKKCVVCVC